MEREQEQESMWDLHARLAESLRAGGEHKFTLTTEELETILTALEIAGEM